LKRRWNLVGLNKGRHGKGFKEGIKEGLTKFGKGKGRFNKFHWDLNCWNLAWNLISRLGFEF